MSYGFFGCTSLTQEENQNLDLLRLGKLEKIDTTRKRDLFGLLGIKNIDEFLNQAKVNCMAFNPDDLIKSYKDDQRKAMDEFVNRTEAYNNSLSMFDRLFAIDKIISNSLI